MLAGGCRRRVRKMNVGIGLLLAGNDTGKERGF